MPYHAQSCLSLTVPTKGESPHPESRPPGLGAHRLQRRRRNRQMMEAEEQGPLTQSTRLPRSLQAGGRGLQRLPK